MKHDAKVSVAVLAAVNRMCAPGETVLVILDSNHTKHHVADELEAYCGLVSPGSYIAATDGIIWEYS